MLLAQLGKRSWFTNPRSQYFKNYLLESCELHQAVPEKGGASTRSDIRSYQHSFLRSMADMNIRPKSKNQNNHHSTSVSLSRQNVHDKTFTNKTFIDKWLTIRVRVRIRVGVRAVVPNLWPTGQKWPARPQKVALDLLKNFKNICAKTAKLPILTG